MFGVDVSAADFVAQHPLLGAIGFHLEAVGARGIYGDEEEYVMGSSLER